MTYSQADGDCSFIAEAFARIALPYVDPKAFDGTQHEVTSHAACAQLMGRKIRYCFLQIKCCRKPSVLFPSHSYLHSTCW